MLSDYETLNLAIVDYVATITMNRPPVNAQNNLFRKELVNVVDALGDQ